jgi:predicted nucleotidyltransferase
MAFDLGRVDLNSIEEVDGDKENTTLRSNLSEAIKIDANQHAKQLQLSEETGVPAFAVDESVEQGFKLDQVDVNSITERSPNTAEYLSNFDNSVIAQDDIEVMQAIEEGLKSVQEYGADIAESFGKGQLAVESSEIGLSRMYQALGANEIITDEQLARVREIEELTKQDGDEYGFFSGAPIAAAEQLPIMYEILRTGLGYAAVGAATTGAIGAGVGALAGGVGAIPGAIAGAIPGAKIAGRVGIAKAAFDLEAGLAFNEYIGLKDEEGNTLNPQVAGGAAALVGAVNAGLEFISLAALGRTVTPVMRTIIKSKVKRALVTETGREMITRLVRDYGIAVGTEAVTETAQEFTNVVGAELAKHIDKESFTEQDLSAALDNIFSGETAERVLEAGKKGAQAALIFAGVGTTASVVAESRQRERLSNNEQLRIDALNGTFEKSKLRERDKEAFKKFVEKADGETNTHVFIDGTQVSLYLQDKTPEEIAADPALQLLAEQAREASVLGGDVQVPVADFATHIAGTDTYGQLRDSMTLSNEAVSPFRQEQVKQETETYVRSLMDEAQESASEYVEAQDIYTTVRDQLIDSGQVTPANASIMAQIVPAWATAQARRQGKTVQQVYTDSGLVIEGPQTGERARLEGEQVLTQAREQGFEGDSAVEAAEYTRAVEKGLDMSQDARLQRARDMGFDTEQTLYHGTTADVAEFDIKAQQVSGDIGEFGIFLTDNPDYASAYAEDFKGEPSPGGNVIQSYVTLRNPKKESIELIEDMETEWSKDEIAKYKNDLIDQGHDGVIFEGKTSEYVVFDPSQIRSVNAAFDPDFKESGDLLAQPIRLDVEGVQAEATEALTKARVASDRASVLVKSEIEKAGLPADVYDGIYLVGSRAEGTQRPGKSDIDILVKTNPEATGDVNNIDVVNLEERLETLLGDIEGVDWFVSPKIEGVAERFAQAPIAPDKNLFVAHNLSAENIIAAEELGGLAAPSLAVARADISDFSSFGEVTLLADPSLLEDPKARTFDADIYSPRQPRAQYDVNLKQYKAFTSQLDTENFGLPIPDIGTLEESSGPDDFLRSESVQYYWLKSQGKAPTVKNQKVEPIVRKAAKFDINAYSLNTDERFIKMAVDYYQSIVNSLNESDRLTKEDGGWEALYFEEDGSVKPSRLMDLSSKVQRFRDTGGKDVHRLRDDISKKLRSKKAREEYEQWATAKFNSLVDRKTLFKGFTASGTRRYSEYNLLNVVKDMTQQLQAGESTFYGAGTVRSAYANEMKTIRQIQAKRDEIITEADMAKIKDESSDVFQNALEELKPFYKFESDSWGYGSDAGNAILEGRKGIREAFDMTPEAQKIVDDLLEYLVALPTSYFESKVQRAVDFNEFDTAVVPKGMRKDALQVLKDAGLKIKTYDPETKGARADIIAKQQKLLFQRTGKQPTVRGYYDPANSVIRLTEASDLSTFLHEFAHFMYEMEVNGDTEMLQSINNWYKRNADDVAKEANSYLGKKFDELKQSVFHGTPHKFDKFSLDAMGTGEGAQAYGWGLYFSSKRGVAEWYRDALVKPKNATVRPEAGKYRATYTDRAGQSRDMGLFNTMGAAWRAIDEQQGAIYQVNIPEDDTLLDWGRPLSEQSEGVKENLEKKFSLPSFNEDFSTAGEFYKSRVRKFDSQEKASKELSSLGIKGLRYLDGTSRGTDGDTYNYVIWDEESVTIEAINDELVQAEQFAQPTDRPTAKEGSITADDVVAFLDQTTTGDQDKDAAIRRAVHEQFARGFETYLMEGKAPSIELRNAFRAFARWLSRIYQSLRNQLDVQLDEEMRQVFDRLIATEEQIAAAESRARIEPLFTDVNASEVAKMTEEEFAKYQQQQEKVKDLQSETLRDKLIKQLTRQTKAWWKEEKQDIIEEEIDALSREQVYVTRARLRDGDLKLDHATVKEMTGEAKTDKLGRTSIIIPPKLVGMTAKGQKGVHPDEAAAFFGYGSGSEMLNDLNTAPNIKVAAETTAEARMIERHGDILTDGTIEKEADEAVMNEERGKLILRELKALAKGTAAPTIDRATIKELSEQNIGKLSFKQIHPGKYRKAEIRAAQEAVSMLAAGNREGAAAAKMRQVMNYYLGMAATNAKNETTKIVDRMSRYNRKSVREAIQKVEGGYWEQLTKILNRFEFRKSATLKEVESLNVWMNERNGEAGDSLVLTNSVLNESYVTHWKNVPFSDLQGISDSVKNIEHVARYADKLTRTQEEIDFNKLVDRWVTSMEENVDTRFVSKRTDVVEGRKWGRWLMAQMTKIPYMASWLDGGERVGISHQIMVQPFTDAYNAEIQLWGEAGKPVMDAIENRSKEDRKRHNRKIYIPEIDDNLYGHQIVAVALNTGNQSNLKKMLLGEGWADPEIDTDITFDNGKLQAILSHMTKSDWELVQQVWDQMETLYPKLAEVHQRTTGLVPPKIESTPVKTKFGTFKGGYYPVKYDPNRDQRAQQNEDKLNAETESMFSNSASIQSSVNTSATNERTGYYAPIRLSLDVVPAHFQETIHYITHHDPVREVNRLTRNKQVAQTIKEKLGPEEYAQLRPWLNDIAKDGREAPTKMFWDDILGRLRFGVTLGVMGFKASTGIIQISGLSNSIAEVGTANMFQSMRSILGSTTTIRQAWDFAVENSQVLEHRTQTMDREIKNAMKRIEGKRGMLAGVQEASMKHIAYIQTYMVDLPTWHAAYIKGMTDWGDEARAFQYADWVIENVQGSGATKDMARIMRGQSETGRMFTMFMTFFSALWNMERDLVKGAKSGKYSTTNVAAKAMFLFTIPVLFEMMMRGELGEPDEGDDDERLQKMLTGVAMFPVQSIPFIRDIATATTGEFGYNISPLQSVIEQGTSTIPELIKRGFTDEEITKGQVKGATKFIGATLGIPGVNQAWATGEHLYDVIEEGEELTLHQTLFGPERK